MTRLSGTRNITVRSRYGERANAFREGAWGDTDVLLLVSALLLLKRLRLVLVAETDMVMVLSKLSVSN